MSPERARITPQHISQLTAAAEAIGPPVDLTADEILRLSDATPGVRQLVHDVEGDATHMRGIFRKQRTEIAPINHAVETQANTVADGPTNNEEWVVGVVQQAVQTGELDVDMYKKLCDTSVGDKAKGMLHEYGVKIVSTRMPEDIFKPSPSSRTAAPLKTTNNESSPKTMNGVKRGFDAAKSFIPGYRGAKIAMALGAVATVVACGALTYKVTESVSYDTSLGVCRSNAIVCGMLKFGDGIVQGGLDLVDIAIPGGKK